MKSPKPTNVTPREVKPQREASKAPPRELTFREKLVGAYLDHEGSLRAAQQKADAEAQEMAWNSICRFLSIPDHRKGEASLFAFDNHPEWGFFVEYDGVRVARDRGSDGFRYVSACPYCEELVISSVFFNSTVGLGEQVFREDNKTFTPCRSHLAECPKAPATEKADASAPEFHQSPAEKLYNAIRSAVK